MRCKLFVRLLLCGLTLLAFSAPTSAQKAIQEVHVFDLEYAGKRCRVVLEPDGDPTTDDLVEYPEPCEHELGNLHSFITDDNVTEVVLLEKASVGHGLDVVVVLQRINEDVAEGIIDDGIVVRLIYLGFYDPYANFNP